MKDYKNLIIILIVSVLLAGLTSCTNYTSNLVNQSAVFKKEELKTGKTCSHNLLGGFKVPYIKDTTIKVKGSESIIDAIKDGQIEEVFIVDTSNKHYLFYTIQCTIAHGK